MTARIVSVQELLRVRICRGRNCAEDAATGDGYCAGCDRKLRLGLDIEHTPAKLLHADLLRCSACGGFKPDGDFSPSRERPKRRFRHVECKNCAAKRSREHRARRRLKSSRRVAP